MFPHTGGTAGPSRSRHTIEDCDIQNLLTPEQVASAQEHFRSTYGVQHADYVGSDTGVPNHYPKSVRFDGVVHTFTFGGDAKYSTGYAWEIEDATGRRCIRFLAARQATEHDPAIRNAHDAVRAAGARYRKLGT